ncbi:DUF1353 domain-containing protein [Qipengyuania sp. S6317L1]|uniref:DUF1353 domain-containing protein n=1 Tax=Qipengyuania sp. S6317L1 TaxID=2926410 RepID=UPI001FF340C4|nr:DUF1353 domain-containing protein [Qipengyuania sp. S6317L1]MCK0098849.1 DUF1353 domain-containing protein [Qipengyuania sp. S6317L1]
MKRRDLLKSAVTAALFVSPTSILAQSRNSFSAGPLLLPAGGQNMRLMESFSYRDPNGMLWTVPAGYVSNGASIPKSLWSFAGGPWSGDYNKAAIIHDRYCDTKARTWEATHLVFKYAMLANGVSSMDAEVKYSSVFLAGPRWNDEYIWTGFWGWPNRVRRRLMALTDIDAPETRAAQTIARSREAAWERAILDDVQKSVEASGPAAFDIRSYTPPTTFDQQVALNEASEVVKAQGILTPQEQLLLPQDELLKYERMTALPVDDPAVLSNSATLGEIEATIQLQQM